ncbi:glycosyltransferase family 1 protein [Pedobacter polaris]|uniref:Glycosyltransferase family 1 protein n=1 Tax=Pedobacter polaris TaxID=2571273 RepID=A0A4U1CKL6_9SPHI|nr:glycosyltransferase [Pedobacter polaris]TKC08180.1 glycosyltransferase family 1 protein [Pedobacter polaris]
MNIFLAFFQSKVNHKIPAYSFWEYYIKNGIEEAGYNWTEAAVDWAEGLVHSQNAVELASWKSRTWELTLNEIRKQHKKKPISLFLSYLYPHQVDEQTIIQIKSMGIPCVNFFCDNVREFTKAPKEFSVFDLNWVPEYKALDMYKNSKYNFIHLPMPMWVEPQYRYVAATEINEVSFIGSKDIQRTMLFEDIVNKNVDLKIYGAGWLKSENELYREAAPKSNYLKTVKNQLDFINRFGLSGYYEKFKQKNSSTPISVNLRTKLHGKLQFDEYIKITQQSVITLGVNRYPSFRYPLKNPNTYSRLRDIEAPMLGACYLTEYTQGLEILYDLGNEIETYTNVEEMLAKIDMLKRDKNKRNELRINGQKRSLNEHSIINSIHKITHHLNI